MSYPKEVTVSDLGVLAEYQSVTLPHCIATHSLQAGSDMQTEQELRACRRCREHHGLSSYALDGRQRFALLAGFSVRC